MCQGLSYYRRPQQALGFLAMDIYLTFCVYCSQDPVLLAAITDFASTELYCKNNDEVKRRFLSENVELPCAEVWRIWRDLRSHHHPGGSRSQCSFMGIPFTPDALSVPRSSVINAWQTMLRGTCRGAIKAPASRTRSLWGGMADPLSSILISIFNGAF